MNCKVIINKNRCKGCMLCMHFCTKNELALSKELNRSAYRYAEFMNKGKCSGCKKCAIVCPDAAIEIRKEISYNK